MAGTTLIEIEGCNGEWEIINGEGKGENGVHLGTGINGIYDGEVKPLYSSHAFQEGSTYNGKRILQRTVTFGVHIRDTPSSPWQENDSRWRKMFDYERESKIWITKDDSRRWLSVRLGEPPQFSPTIDPEKSQYGEVIMTLVASDPWWYEADYTDTFVATEDTTDGHFQMGTITIANPTDHEVYPQWLLQAPGQPRLPDFSWGDKRHNGYGTNGYFDAATAFATRQIVMAELLPNHHVRVDTRPDARDGGYQSTDQTYRQRMKMVRFLYPIPPYTKPIELPVGMSKALPGTGIQVRIPRPWSRPWGLEA